MDNITHTLVGVLVGEAASRVSLPSRTLPGAGTQARGLPQGLRRSLIITTLAVGSNLPDADLLYTSLASGRLAYVLQHRGYTHTVPGALLLAGLLWLACEGWMRWRHLLPSAADRRWIAGSALAGVTLHLLMDYTNSYGLHPFWPFYDGWLYGDSVFIVEPLIWVAAAPLVFLLRTPPARWAVGAVLSLGTLAVAGSGLVPGPAVVGFVVLLATALAAGRLLPARASLAVGISIWLGITATFIAAGHAAALQVDAAAHGRFPGATTLDHVLSPMPADPACWDVLLVQQAGGLYQVHAARLSLLPHWIAAGDCRGVGAIMRRTGFAPVQGARDLQWQAQYSMPADRLAGLADRHCVARAFMQFARVPWASQAGAGWLLGDLRFGDGTGFAQLRLTEPPERCAFAPVPWLPPRPELLQHQRLTITGGGY